MSARDWWSGKVAVVTGATRGIGRQIVEELTGRGVAVVLNGRDEGVLAREVSTLRDAGAQVAAVRGSISDPSLPDRLVQAAHDELGGLDFVVNNAATSASYGPLLEVDREAFAKTMLANTWCTVAIVQQAFRAGLSGGAVVNISTTGAQRVHPTTGPYTASKAALESLTYTLARELGPRDVTVNAVAPGLVRTDLARVLWEGERLPQETALVPMGRLGEPSDIANAVVFLLSGEARWVTGVVLRVDGGRMHVGGEPADSIGVRRAIP